MKKKIKVGGEDAGEIKCKPITLVYDGTYGTEKIEIEDVLTLDCRKLVSTYDKLTDDLIDGWNREPHFVYLWCIMWGGNVRNKIKTPPLPKDHNDFMGRADNIKYVWSLLSALITKQVQAVQMNKQPRIQYPECGLHPGIQANLGEVFICMSLGHFPAYLQGFDGLSGDEMVDIIRAKGWCSDNNL